MDILKKPDLKNLKIETPENQCKGHYWKCYVSSYSNAFDYIGVKKSLRHLKRRSCKGCSECAWFDELITEFIDLDRNEDFLAGLEDGKIYALRIDTSQGYYDPYPEVDNIEFVEVKE